jgi:hypothetical protein
MACKVSEWRPRDKPERPESPRLVRIAIHRDAAGRRPVECLPSLKDAAPQVFLDKSSKASLKWGSLIF